MALRADDALVLRRTPLLSGLSRPRAEALEAAVRVIDGDDGDVLFHQGDPADAVLVVLAGWVKLARTSPDGRETIINVFTAGQSFGEAVALTGQAYPAGATCVSAARIARLPSSALVRLVTEHPDAALAIIAATSAHLHFLVSQIEVLKGSNGLARVAEFLLAMCGSSDGPHDVLLPYEKNLIAARLGMTPETLSRAFARLKAHGIELNARHAVIPERAVLQNLLG